MQLNWFFHEYYGEAQEYKAQLVSVNHDLERQKLRSALLQSQFIDFQQEVAQILPIEGKADKPLVGKKDSRLSELTQVLRLPASENKIETSSVLMMSGREQFKEGHYDRSASIFREVIEKYPTSSQVIDAHFLLGESLFQLSEYEECLNIVYEMMNHFPQNQMTGYLMLRNGQILSMRKRNHEASEIYQLVADHFSEYRELSEQARKLAIGK